MARTPSQNRGSPWSHDTHEILQRGDESVYATALVLAKGRINSVSWMQESSRTIMLGNWLGDKKSLLICLMATTSPVFMFKPFHTRPKAPLPRESPSCWFRNTKMSVNRPWGECTATYVISNSGGINAWWWRSSRGRRLVMLRLFVLWLFFLRPRLRVRAILLALPSVAHRLRHQ